MYPKAAFVYGHCPNQGLFEHIWGFNVLYPYNNQGALTQKNSPKFFDRVKPN